MSAYRMALGEMGGTTYGPFGCNECGYQGRVRFAVFVPLHIFSDADSRRPPHATGRDK